MPQSPSSANSPNDSGQPSPEPEYSPSTQVQEIPLSKVMICPDQPRKVIDQDKLTQLENSIREAGQQTACKVRLLTPEEKMKYPGIAVMNLGGQRRQLAVERVGLPTLKCLVLGVTPEEGDLVALLDNKWEDMFWLDWDIAIERMYNRASKTNQSKVAAILGVDQTTVSRALKVPGALNAASRELIYAACIKLKDKDPLPEGPIRALAELKDPEKVEKALSVHLKSQFNEPEAKGLVQWVQAGNNPETFDRKRVLNGAPDPNDPNAGLWEALPKGFKVQLTPKGYKLSGTLTQGEGPLGVYSLFAALEEAKRLQGRPNDPRFKKEIPRLQLGARQGIARNTPGGPALVEVKSFSDFLTGLVSWLRPQAENKGLSTPIPEKGIGAGLGAWLQGLWATIKAKLETPPATPPAGAVNPSSGPAPANLQGTANPSHTQSLWAKAFKWEWKDFWKGIFWLVSLPIRMFGKGLKQCAEGIFLNGLLQMAFAILLCWGLLWAWHHPGRIIGEAKGFVSRSYHEAIGESESKPTPEVSAAKPVEGPPQAVPKEVASPHKPQPSNRSRAVAMGGTGGVKKVASATQNSKLKPAHRSQAVEMVGVGGTQNSPAPVASPPSSTVVSDKPMDTANSPKELTQPNNGSRLDASTQADSAFVLKFAEALYSIGYLNYATQETALLGWVTKDYAGDLKGHYFNPYVRKNMESLHRIKTFTPDGPVKWISSNETTEEFMVSGTITGQGEWNGQPSNSIKHVKARIEIIHDTSGKILVKKISEEITD